MIDAFVVLFLHNPVASLAAIAILILGFLMGRPAT